MEYPTDVLFDTIIRYESFTYFLSLKHNEWKVLLKTVSVQTSYIIWSFNNSCQVQPNFTFFIKNKAYLF